MQVDYDLREIEELAELLQKNILKNGLEKSLDVIGGMIVSSAQERLSEGGPAPDGSAWADWSADYAKTRGAEHGKLKSEGDLAKDLSHFVKGADVIMGSKLPYARIHQLGGKAGRNLSALIPARQYIGISKFDEDNIRETLRKYFNEGMESHFAN